MATTAPPERSVPPNMTGESSGEVGGCRDQNEPWLIPAIESLLGIPMPSADQVGRFLGLI